MSEDRLMLERTIKFLKSDVNNFSETNHYLRSEIITTKAELERIKFRLWAGFNPIHDIDTREIVRWELTPEGKVFMEDCWREGLSPLQKFKKESEKG